MLARPLLLASTLAVAACRTVPDGAAYLPKHTPDIAEHPQRLFVERGVDVAEAARIAAHFQSAYPSPYPFARIHRVPGRPDRYLVTAPGPREGEEYGLRFFLVAVRPDTVIELARSRGMWDSAWLEPVFFAHGECQYVLADTGSEESWGLEVFRLCGDTLHAMGRIDVSAPASDTIVAWPESPLPHARMRMEDRQPVVEFTADLVQWVDPDGDSVQEQVPLRRRGTAPIAFRWNGTEFVLQPGHAVEEVAEADRAPDADPWSVTEVLDGAERPAVIRFASGDEFATTLFEVRVLGQIPRAGAAAPYLVLAGRSCHDCDANLSIYVHSPADGPMQGAANEERYGYPGTVIEWEPEVPSDTIASRTRFFLGDCMPALNVAAIWFTEERTAPAELVPSVFALFLEKGKLEPGNFALPLSDSGPKFTGLDEVLEQVAEGTCREIPGIEQLREP